MTERRPVHEIEKKWQARWEADGTYRAVGPGTRNPEPVTHAGDTGYGLRVTGEKFYGLIEFPYPSGDGLHVGHPRSYTAIDVVTRKKRMEGRDVLYPIGWDAFGLPTENYAIKNKIKPQDATAKNVANFTRQLKSLGFGFDWSREINTTDPTYYKWTQWQFLQFYKHGLAYKAKTTINWCPKDKIGLANEEAEGGVCERCGTPVEQREKEQWMIAITKYADRLIEDLETVDYLPRIKTQQVNWIGKSEGARITFPLVVPGEPEGKHVVTVFTTRPDTLFGATFLVISPELAKKWLDVGWKASDEVRTYIANALQKKEEERSAEGREKTGVATGVEALHPVTGEKLPVWIADYVLGNYGTGAIMAVPAHDERDFDFAAKYALAVKPVVRPLPLAHVPTLNAVPSVQQTEVRLESECFVGEGEAINSDFLNGLPTWKAKQDMISWLEEHKKGERAVTYKLRDWVFSRQRYWGEPIPMIHCAACALRDPSGQGYVPVPDDQLPVTLPPVEAYEPTDTGESPLANIRSWVEVSCPKCQGKAERETDTMPNWAGSSWYFLRYCDPENDQALADPEKLKYWMPVDLYNGGMEHTTLHLLYSRFWYKFLWDIGAVPKACGPEPYKVRRSHGLILAQGGEKMSKSKGNVVNPDEVVNQYGADVFRVYEMFMGPFDQPVPWDTNGIEGVRRFLDKVWLLFPERAERVEGQRLPNHEASTSSGHSQGLETLYHQTVKKITEGVEKLEFNTCVSQLMILTNAYQDAGGVPVAQREGFLQMLAPFAPHLAEELWEKLGKSGSIHHSGWPVFDSHKLQAPSFELVLQVNGKVRDRVQVPSDISEEEAKAKAFGSEKMQQHLQGKEPKQVVYVKGKLVNIVV